MESKTKNKQTREQIERMAGRAFDGLGLAAGAEAVRELKEGWFNAAYNVRLAGGREVILKIAPPQDADVLQYEKNIMATEVAAMRLVRQNPAIPVPEIYFFDDTRELCNADYFFMEKIEGDNLEHVKASLPAEIQEAIDLRIGAIIREVNSFPGVYFGYDGNPALRAESWKAAFLIFMDALLEDAARKQAVFDYSYDELRRAVLHHASALEEITTPCLVHWDAWNPNFFVKDGQITGIIDFERALWAEPLMEAQFRQLFGDGVTHAMRGYGKTSFTFAEEQRKQLYSLHLALTMNIECYYRNYDTDDIFNLSRQLIGAAMTWLQANP
jgi:aminoglycoside phosphotransferase (APT) family kinase protein